MAKVNVAGVGVVTVAPVSMSVDKAVDYTGVGRSTLYDMIKNNELPIVRVRGRTLLLREDLDTYLRGRRVFAGAVAQAETTDAT